jgi:hypothetical protein
MREMYQTE